MRKGLSPPSSYYWIGTKTVYDDGFVGVQDPDWFEQACEHGVRCECRAIHPDYSPMPVDMDLAIEPPGFCSPARLAFVIRRDFYECIRTYATDQIIGRTFLTWEDDDGTIGRDPYPDFVTCYTPPELTVSVRGGKRSWYIYCKLCRHWYTSYTTKPNYLLITYSHGRHVLQGRHGDIYLSDSLFDSIDWAPFPDLEYETIGLRDDPIDGLILPGDPGWDPANHPDGVIE